MAAGQLSILLLVWLFSGFVELHASVPVLIWSKESLPSEGNPVLAGHTVTASDFKQNYLDKILSTSTTICLFIQDKLSIDDISRYGDAYSPGSHSSAFDNLRTAVESANSSVVLPSVASPTSGLVDYIRKSASGKVVELLKTDAKSIKSISNQELDSRRTNVFIIHLQPLAESTTDSVSDVLDANDLVIGQVLRELNSLATPYTCILTADSPSQHVEKKQMEAAMSSVAHDRLRRAVELDAGSNMHKYPNSTLLWNECVLLYIEKVHVVHKKGEDMFNMTSSDITQVKPEGCGSSLLQFIKFSVKDQSGSRTADLKMTFVRSGSSWMCTNITITATPGGEQTVPCTSMQVPRSMAYSCQDGAFKYYKKLNASESITTIIKFTGFQAEAFANTTIHQRFHDAYDCVGFFTIPIFMGLLTVGVLLTILFGGILATMSISTMDRFDDPKGPGIQIGSSN